MLKFGATRDNAEQNWVSRTEQQKVRYRKEEQTSAILEYQQRRKQLEGDIDGKKINGVHTRMKGINTEGMNHYCKIKNCSIN